MMKHAYLIIAHSNLKQLHKLLLLLDDPRNDIYIHLDLKSKLDIKKITPPQPVREQLFWVYHRGQNRYHDST